MSFSWPKSQRQGSRVSTEFSGVWAYIPLLDRYARAATAPPVRQLVIDREGMAAAFLARLADDGCDVVTVLRADQYAGLASFADVGPFVPFQYDRAGTLVREVAPARFALALPDHPNEQGDSARR